MTSPAPGRFEDLRTRLVGGSLLRRTVVTVAAFTMTTVLLLGLLSAAAIGATRAVAGAPAPDSDAPAVDAVDAADDAGDGDDTADAKPASKSSKASSSKANASKTKTSKQSKAEAKGEPRRAGGAVSPGDALERSGHTSEGEEER